VKVTETVGETAAQAYERLLVQPLFAPTAAMAARLAAIAPGERVIDLACGTGIGLRAAAGHAGFLADATGIDSDADMVATARELLATHQVPSRVLVALADAVPLPAGSFDICLCLQGLQFFDDRQGALREMRRLLAPQGRLVISAWAAIEQVPGHQAVYQALEAHGIDTTSPRRGFELREPRALLELAELQFPHATVEVEERSARFESAMHFVESLFSGAPYTRRVIASLSEEQRRRCVEDACRRLRPFESPAGLQLPLRSHVLVAHNDTDSRHAVR
jgi:ubiquinone/menaquinone biosynthesis C-methylase UbiE